MMAAAIAAMTLGELLGSIAGPHAALAVTDLVSDSRQVTPGAAFVALAGERNHGLEFAAAAKAAGAAIVLFEPSASTQPLPLPGLELPGLSARLGELGQRFYGRDSALETLIGVTGTNGKTTVAWLVAQALTGLDQPCGYIGTLGYGLPDALEPQSLTTPDCLTLHRELAELGTRHAAIEVSSHALSQQRIAGLQFSVAAFTNLSRDHLDWHVTMDAYFAAKAQLFAQPGLRTAVVNADDSYGQVLLGRLAPTVRPITVALQNVGGAMLTARAHSRGLAGQILKLSGEFGESDIETRLIGEFNAENLLLALGVLIACGHDLDVAAAALCAAAPAPGRMEVFGGPPDLPWVVVDYAHTPQALERVLTGLTATGADDISCVFGCGGDRDRGKRALMGQAAARYAQHIVLTDDNPRSEDPAAIVADIKSGIARHGDLRVQHARDRAIAEAIARAAPGAVVLIAGKGHETVQLKAGESRPFDDRALVRSILEGRS